MASKGVWDRATDLVTDYTDLGNRVTGRVEWVGAQATEENKAATGGYSLYGGFAVSNFVATGALSLITAIDLDSSLASPATNGMVLQSYI